MKALNTIALAASLVGVSSGATLIQTQNYAFVPNGSQTVTFNKFDTSLGTLTGVNVSITLNKSGGSFQVDNDSASAGTIDLTHQVKGSLSTSLGATALLNTGFATIGTNTVLVATSTLSSVSISGTTGDATNAFNATGLGDFVSFNPTPVGASDSGDINNFFIGLYQGAGTFTDTVTADQIVSATGVSGLQQSFTVSNISGAVVVTYTYTAIPEPASALLGGLGLLGLVVRRRR
jgi:hypothetical protein